MRNDRIKKLSQKVCNQISAGEVIERPASVVKELVENSIDANADNITIEIKNGGRDLIRVKDDGKGFPSEEIEKAFSRYTTSKINNIEDIYSLQTLGFRGEALASIAAVSKIKVKSRHEKENNGVILELKAGDKITRKNAGLPQGAEITVRDLFFNTPARFKHLKKPSTEAVHVNRHLTAAALANPGISFKLYHEGNENISTPGNDDLRSTIYSLYGEKVHENLVSVNFSRDYLKVAGYIINPNVSRSARKHEFFFINQRPAQNKFLRDGIEQAYSGFLPKNRYPLVFLNIEINPILVDVNVHPSKKRIKFSRGDEIKDILAEEISKALANIDSSQNIENIETLEQKPGETEYSNKNNKNDKSETIPNISTPKQNLSNTAFDFSVDDQEKENYFLSDFDFQTGKENDYTADVSEEKIEQSEDLNRGVIGQLHNLFILYQSCEGLYIIDQHNAHERVIYEQLKQKMNSKKIESSMLLTPINLELNPEEKELIRELRDNLENYGFKIEEFGPNSYALTAVPIFLKNLNDDTPEDLIFQLLKNKEKQNKSELQEEILKYTSCRQAVKEGVKLDQEEMKVICQKLFAASNPYRCPHKRPIIVNLSLEELKDKVERPHTDD